MWIRFRWVYVAYQFVNKSSVKVHIYNDVHIIFNMFSLNFCDLHSATLQTLHDRVDHHDERS